MKAFEDVAGQDLLCSYLQGALDAGKTTHAYLLVGTDAGVVVGIARRFAAALLSAGDGQVFMEVLNGSHPDLHELEPSGAGAYLVDQVRELVHDAELAPIRAPRKAYIVKQADRLAGAPANALLKTLEEPPADVVCILTAVSEYGVLETIRSRCEVLHARGADYGQPSDEEVFSLLSSVVSGATNAQVLAAAKRMVELSSQGKDSSEAAFEEQLEAGGDFLSSAARKELEAQHKRKVAAQQRDDLLAQVAAVRSWLRDCLLAQAGAPDARAHGGWAAQTMQVATSADAPALLAALEAVKACETRISYNVTPQLAIEALLFEIKEAVCR